MFAVFYTYTTAFVTFALLASIRPYGRLTAKDEADYFVRLATTSLDERRAAAFPTYSR